MVKNKHYLHKIASSGVLELVVFLYWSMQFDNMSFLYIDNFDAFYHYELSHKLVELLNSKSNFQSFVTTHNTSVMNNRLMRRDTLFLISNNKIKPLCNWSDGGLREGHSLEKMYRAGGFSD